jgi:hypothetical protein
MRASGADRDRVVEVLKYAFIQERLAKDEFADRIGQALAARTWADLDALTADIPAGPHRAASLVPAMPVRSLPAAAVPDRAAETGTDRGDGPPGIRPGNRPASRPEKALVAGMAGVILLSGVSGSVLAGPGPGVVITGLVAGVVFMVLWVVACSSIVRERPRP